MKKDVSSSSFLAPSNLIEKSFSEFLKNYSD
jgi:hypothetical protein